MKKTQILAFTTKALQAFVFASKQKQPRSIRSISNFCFAPYLDCQKIHANLKKQTSQQQKPSFVSPQPFSKSNRLFGSRRRENDENTNNISDNDEFAGSIIIMNEQSTHQTLDECIPHFNRVVKHIRSILGYPTYDIVVAFVDDAQIQELNNEFLGKDRPTDILSFPFDDDVIVEPGVLKDPDFDFSDYYSLGDIMICIPYIMRRTEEDMKDLHDGNLTESELKKERGISGIMATMKTVEERVPALLVHGMLHLVGYDHIEDDDYELMVNKEEEVWNELQRKIKNDPENK